VVVLPRRRGCAPSGDAPHWLLHRLSHGNAFVCLWLRRRPIYGGSGGLASSSSAMSYLVSCRFISSTVSLWLTRPILLLNLFYKEAYFGAHTRSRFGSCSCFLLCDLGWLLSFLSFWFGCFS
jgi:hypothetical protein